MPDIPTWDKENLFAPTRRADHDERPAVDGNPVGLSPATMLRADSVAEASPRGREEFWATAVNGLRPRLRRYIAKSACDEDEIEEIVADVVGELVSRETAFTSCSNHWEFVLPILRQRCAEAKCRWRSEIGTARELSAPVQTSRWEEREEYLTSVAQWLQQAMPKLPHKQREALRLRYLEGREYAEVSALLGSSQNSARFNVHAALSRLREMAYSEWPRGFSNKTTAKRP